jgi:hypothetical protein
MDRVIGFLAERGRALLAKLGLGADPKQQAGQKDDELGTTVRFSAGHEAHRLFVQQSGPDATLMVASTALSVAAKVEQWREKLPGLAKDTQPKAKATLKALDAAVGPFNKDASALAKARKTAQSDPAKATSPPSDDALEAEERALATVLRDAFVLFEDVDPAVYLKDIAAHVGNHGKAYAEKVFGAWESPITKPKRPDDGATPIWGGFQFPTRDGLRYLDQKATREQLLPWFLVGSQHENQQRGAESGTFADYAFATDSPDPPHRVRPQFITALGEDAADELKKTGLRVVKGAENKKLRTTISSMRFAFIGGRWGTFVNLPADQVDPLVKDAIANAGGIVAFLRSMVRSDQAGGITWTKFLAVWEASQETKNYAKALFRRVEPDSHEWIPTGHIPEVVVAAVKARDKAGLVEAFRWITAQVALRSPTRWVLYKPLVEKDNLGNTVITIGGHPTARERKTTVVAGKVTLVFAGSIDTDEFHEWLRTEFDAQKGLGALSYINHLENELRHRVWDGTVRRFSPVLLQQQLGSGPDAGISVGELARRQRLNWQGIADDFTRARNMVKRERGGT